MLSDFLLGIGLTCLIVVQCLFKYKCVVPFWVRRSGGGACFPVVLSFSLASCHSTIDLCLSVLGPLHLRYALGLISVLLKPQLGLDL
jgi:hypothetical protein